MITSIETQKIYADHGIDLTSAEIIEITADANENGKKNYRGLNAHEWVIRWAKSNAAENDWNPSFSERLEYEY